MNSGVRRTADDVDDHVVGLRRAGVAAVEEIAGACMTTPHVLLVNWAGTCTILSEGSDELQDLVVPQVASERAGAGCAGTDVAGPSTTATVGWSLTGQKRFISNAPWATGTRSSPLVIALLGMALATFAIGVLPTFAAFGVAATVLLMIARIAQGLSAGGEIGGAAPYLAEQSPVHRRGFYTSLVNLGVLAGTASASLAVFALNAVLTREQMLAWGWRQPFLIALPLGLVGIYIRRRLEDSPQFLAAKEEGRVPKVPAWELMARHRKALVYGFVMAALIFGTFYVVFSYSQIFLVQVVDLSPTLATLSPTVALLVGLALQSFFGTLGDRFGRRPVLAAAIILMVVLAYPAFMMLTSGNTALVLIGNAVLGVPVVLIQAVDLGVLCELFPTTVRYSGVALAFNVAAVVFGGTTPLLCTWLISATGSVAAPAFYLIALCLAAAPFVATIEETANRPMRQH